MWVDNPLTETHPHPPSAQELPRRKHAENPLVFFDVSISGEYVGRVVVEFFIDVVPKV